jgi:hypothetical protein
MPLREKTHRLSREFYKGEISVAFTVCLRRDIATGFSLQENEDIAAQVRYILDNPVRKGLVSSWEEYPFRGSIGCDLENILNGII